MMNPYTDQKKLAERIAEVKKSRGAGPIAAPEPLPKRNGIAVHRTLLDGVPVHLKFDQQPPEGSIPIPQTNKKWLGSLLFIDPSGEIWTVPHVWYNGTWKERIESLEASRDRAVLNNNREKAIVAEINKIAHPNEDQKRRRRDAAFNVRQYENNHKLTVDAIEHIRKHAKMDSCPSLSPIPEREAVPA